MPHVAPLLVASMLARLPFGMYALALVLYAGCSTLAPQPHAALA